MRARLAFPLAIVIVCLAALITHRTTVVLGAEGVYGAFGFGWLGVIKPVRVFLERRKVSLTFAPDPEEIVPPADFHLPWHQMFIYGVFLLVGGLEVAGFLVGVIGAFVGADESSLGGLLVVGTLFAAPVILFGLGSWMGSYCTSYGVRVLFAVALIGRILVGLLDFVLLPEATFQTLFAQEKSLGIFLQTSIAGIVVFALFAATVGLLGFWRGRRLRPARYLRFLLDRVDRSQREAIMASAHEQVRTA